MSNESLEQRARELLAAEYAQEGLSARAFSLRSKQQFSLDAVDRASTRAITRALESTPAQEVELPEPMRMGHSDRIPFEGYYTAAQLRAYGQACASARTAPAEGGMTVEQARELITNTIGFGFDEDYVQPVNAHDMSNLAEAFAAATTAPVVGDDHATDAEIAAWLERHDLTSAIRGGDARCAFEDAQTFAITKTTARTVSRGDA